MATTARPRTRHAHAGHAAAPKHQALIDSALKCVGRGEVCVDHCLALDVDGRYLAQGLHARGPGHDADVFDTHARGGLRHGRVSRRSPKVCLDICADCEKECKKHAEHHAACKACMESCADCVAECKKVI